MGYEPGGGYPELAALRGWLKVPATVLSDDDLGVIAAAEQAEQTIRLDPYVGETAPDAVVAAFYRRVARHAAAKSIPLGILGADAEYGAVRLSRWETEVDRLEAPYTPVVVA